MRIFEVGPEQARQVADHGSRGFGVQPLVRGDGVAVTVLRLAAGGEIGRHPTVADQLFLVVAGRGAVCGGDGEWRPVQAGQAVLWEAGEQHTTRADEELTAVAVELAPGPTIITTPQG